ncbi:hypothetical protein LOK49_LG14G01336 [Camellia lanceoleosa]|uniref:Uncharacterized protein n=1 Tax=Camellia lanceoleosa TaxID=1840588 RepID=A0ACC0FD87_9ERIC|nr:hypothetical protein LOK49_LG14G01336 [Camellia lanceoleosa]
MTRCSVARRRFSPKAVTPQHHHRDKGPPILPYISAEVLAYGGQIFSDSTEPLVENEENVSGAVDMMVVGEIDGDRGSEIAVREMTRTRIKLTEQKRCEERNEEVKEMNATLLGLELGLRLGLGLGLEFELVTC